MCKSEERQDNCWLGWARGRVRERKVEEKMKREELAEEEGTGGCVGLGREGYKEVNPPGREA